MEIYWQKKSDTTPLSGDFGSAVAKLMNFAYILSKHVSTMGLVSRLVFVEYIPKSNIVYPGTWKWCL